MNARNPEAQGKVCYQDNQTVLKNAMLARHFHENMTREPYRSPSLVHARRLHGHNHWFLDAISA